MSSRRANTAIAVGIVVIVAVALGIGGYVVRRRASRVPAPGSAAYEQLTRHFYHGLAALQVGLLNDAKSEFTEATSFAPGEPAAWADLALTDVRLDDFDSASAAIGRATSLAPRDGAVALLHGQLEIARGRLNEGISELRRAVDLDPQQPRPLYTLAEAIESAAGPDADEEAQTLLDQLMALGPDNLAVLVERGRLAAKRRDRARLQDSTARLDAHSRGWPPLALEQQRALDAATRQQDFAAAARALAVLRNVLLPVAAFRDDLAAVQSSNELIGQPFEAFLRAEPPASSPSPPDDRLTYTADTLDRGQPAGSGPVLAFSAGSDSASGVWIADDHRVREGRADVALPVPDARPLAVSGNGLLALDWNRDFRTDLVWAGPSGVRLLLQAADGTFRDDTTSAGAEGVTAACAGAWTADLDMDGDLDLIAGLEEGAPVVLRNNGDGTWRRTQPFSGVVGLRAFAWGDLDGDGAPDAALVDRQGRLLVFENRQGGVFGLIKAPPNANDIVAIAVGDIDGDGMLDLVTLDQAGDITRDTWRQGRWDEQRLATWTTRPAAAAPGTLRLFLADLDNNGALDVVASGAGRSQVWLSDGRELRPLATGPDGEVFSVADLNADGTLDLIGRSGGQPVSWLGRGTKGYHWQVIRPRAQMTAGDQRINSFGIGAEIEVRSGLLLQKQVVTDPAVHFGLGTRTGIDVSRIVWPNGVMQADFDRQADQVVVADQRLKGSCPWVFTYDGTGMRFVTDFLWRSPLGLRINAQDTAGVTHTEDWVKISGEQLVPRNGTYDVRITAELWETHFIDYVSLMTVDHPADTEVFVDERFAKQPPALAVRVVEPPRPVARAWDDAGRDVTDLVAREDGRYLATFPRGPYQGVAKDHYVEFELGRPIPQASRLWLVASGWTYPTDSSINLAIAQGHTVHPMDLSLEAEDQTGRWVVVSPDLGFPAGKNKTILIDLSAVRLAGVSSPRRLRLRTNLEIYWDRLATAVEATGTRTEEKRLAPTGADLRFRGFSRTSYSRRDQPEVPDYESIANVAPRWRDLVGYYTRFGDVRELLAGVDDRYVIMNAGDELRLLFSAPPAPPAGWKRDFVLIGDGWNKDGDYNTSFSKTVLPLPSHDEPDYGRLKLRALEDDPVYRRHWQDWQTYHTRYVTPDGFLAGLR